MCVLDRVPPLKEVTFDARIYLDKWHSDDATTTQVENLTMDCWHSPNFDHVRCYVACQARTGKRGGLRRHELRWIGPMGSSGGVHNGEPFSWGNATPLQRRAVILAARAALKEIYRSDPDEGTDEDGDSDEDDDDQT